jgi:hypothetical protein
MCTTTQKSMAKIYYVLILRHDHHIHTLILNNYTKKNQMSYYIIVYIQHVYNSRYCFLIIFIQWWSILSINTKLMLTRKNCFRYLKLMSPLNAAICTTISWMILFKKQLFDLEVKGQGPTKVMMVRDTPPYGHAPTYQISLTYLERQKCYDPEKKILFKKQLFDLEVKVQQRSLWYATHLPMVMHPHTKYHWPIWSCTHIPNIIDLSRKTKKLWSGQASLRRSRRKKSD